MAINAENYRENLIKALPRGHFWNPEPFTNLWRLLYGLAEEPARLDSRSDQLVEEIDPRTTNELLEDWERVLALPDACTGLGTTLQERRAAVVAKLTTIGGQSRQFYIDMAARYGYTIDITEFSPFIVDQSIVDEDVLAGEEIRFLWQVTIPQENPVIQFHTDESQSEERIEDYQEGIIECLIRRHKPAHTVVIFDYLA